MGQTGFNGVCKFAFACGSLSAALDAIMARVRRPPADKACIHWTITTSCRPKKERIPAVLRASEQWARGQLTRTPTVLIELASFGLGPDLGPIWYRRKPPRPINKLTYNLCQCEAMFTSIWGRLGVGLGSIWGWDRPGVKMGPPRANRRSIWGQCGVGWGVGLGCVWRRSRVNLGSTWGQSGIDFGRCGADSSKTQTLRGLVPWLGHSCTRSILWERSGFRLLHAARGGPRVRQYATRARTRARGRRAWRATEPKRQPSAGAAVAQGTCA